jgi:hypothetical protein
MELKNFDSKDFIRISIDLRINFQKIKKLKNIKILAVDVRTLDNRYIYPFIYSKKNCINLFTHWFFFFFKKKKKKILSPFSHVIKYVTPACATEK